MKTKEATVKDYRIQFSDLTWPLKLAIVAVWVEVSLIILSFSIGFILGLQGY